MNQMDRIEHKIDRIDEKLDAQGERITAAETSVIWLQGHLKFSLSIAVAVIGSLIVALLKGDITW